MNKKPAKLNRTLQLTDADVNRYTLKPITLKKTVGIKSITNKIINQDLFSAIRYLPEKFADLMFIDPPYNMNKKFKMIEFKGMKHNDYENWLDSWLSKLISVLKDNASIYICGDWNSSASIFNVGIKYFRVRNRITWEREKGRGAISNWKNCSEDIWYFTKSDKYTFNVSDVKIRRKVLAPYRDEKRNPKDWKENINGSYRDTFPSNIWNDISVPFWSMPENTDHPAQKPEKLLAKIILASTNKGDIVFDPFVGSGTTAVVAKKLGRKYVGVEIDPHYCYIAEKRLELAEKDKRIQGYGGGVFWERNSLLEQIKNQKSIKKVRLANGKPKRNNSLSLN
jgi:site-specific DNA-methyltransferase (adenine-specific)